MFNIIGLAKKSINKKIVNNGMNIVWVARQQ